jgi:ferredoxin
MGLRPLPRLPLYSWVTGVPLIWLVFISGIGGYWIVWDRLAQFSAVASTELLDWLPIFDGVTARNFLAPDSINDRFFTVLVFIHIGVPLMLILGLWAHVNRISRVDYLPTRRVMLATLGAFLLLAAIKPAVSDAPADLSLAVSNVRLDWFILFLHPLTDLTSPGAVWTLIFGATVLLFALPFLPHPARQPIAVVDAQNCNGCSRCHADCPYEAIVMAPHPDKRAHKIAVVDADLCAACGICAGSCPSSTPFRSQQHAGHRHRHAATAGRTRCAGSSKRASPGFPATPGWWSSVATGAPTSAPSRHPIRQR